MIYENTGLGKIIRGSYVNRFSRHILTAWRRFRYSTVLLTTAPLLCCSVVFLYVQDVLLAEENEQLPLARYVVGTLEYFHFVEDFVVVVFVARRKL